MYSWKLSAANMLRHTEIDFFISTVDAVSMQTLVEDEIDNMVMVDIDLGDTCSFFTQVNYSYSYA